MWNLLRKNQGKCSELRDLLETGGELTAVPKAQAHLAECADCQAAVEELRASRVLLRSLPSVGAQASPWFASRVMAAIAARESELRRSLEPWAVVPRLAARLTWISALALLLAGTWLYEMPRSAQSRSFSDATTAESLFDPSPSPAAQDDVLANQVERAQ
jgi:hypothetical protein